MMPPILKYIVGPVMSLLLLASTQVGAEENISDEHMVKAAILYKLLRFIEWPEEQVQSNNIELCLFEHDPISQALEVLGKKNLNVIRKTISKNENSAAIACDVLYASASSRLDAGEWQNRLTSIKSSRPEHAVLTVSDQTLFAEQGGMINLAVRNNRIRFRVNKGAAEQGSIQIGTTLLKLADIVEGRTQLSDTMVNDSE